MKSLKSLLILGLLLLTATAQAGTSFQASDECFDRREPYLAQYAYGRFTVLVNLEGSDALKAAIADTGVFQIEYDIPYDGIAYLHLRSAQMKDDALGYPIFLTPVEEIAILRELRGLYERFDHATFKCSPNPTPFPAGGGGNQ